MALFIVVLLEILPRYFSQEFLIHIYLSTSANLLTLYTKNEKETWSSCDTVYKN